MLSQPLYGKRSASVAEHRPQLLWRGMVAWGAHAALASRSSSCVAEAAAALSQTMYGRGVAGGSRVPI